MSNLRFSEEPNQTFIVPRIEDELIDDLFYQEDEIGEMRHSAFMIECGLEEDPPDGPDVPPVPWTREQLLSQQTGTAITTEPTSPTRQNRELLRRAASADHIEELEAELSPSPRRREPRRRLVAAKSGTLHGMRQAVKKASSSDAIDEDERKAPERRAAPVSRQPKKLVKAKSGSLHGLREAARKARENVEEELPRSPRKLVATKSGALHGMRESARKAKEADADKSPKSPLRSKLVVTKSGTLHGMRKAVESNSSDKCPRSPKRLVATKSGTLHGMRNNSNANNVDPGKDVSPVVPKRRAIKGTKNKKKLDSSIKVVKNSDSDSVGSAHSTGDSEVSLETDEDIVKTAVKNSKKKKAAAGKKSTKKSGKKATVVSPEEASPAKIKNRVYKNGKLVTESSSSQKESEKPTDLEKHSSALDQFRNGTSASALLAQARAKRSIPEKSKSISQVNAQPDSNNELPSIFQKSKIASKNRPGKLKMPLKSKSVSTLEIPPAFRTIGK